jgi:4'-phosphopantetheinyl transferase
VTQSKLSIFYTRFDEVVWERIERSQCVVKLPVDMQNRNARFLRWQDRAANAIGKLMLLYAFDKLELRSLFNLRDVKYTEHHRPYLGSDIDFSISHSGCYVVLSIGRGIRTGVDIEILNPISIGEFSSVFTDTELNEIQQSQDPYGNFFSLWALKESVIKGDGRGFLAPIKEMIVGDGFAELSGMKWFFHPLVIDDDYRAYVAVDSPVVDSNTLFVKPDQLIHCILHK